MPTEHVAEAMEAAVATALQNIDATGSYNYSVALSGGLFAVDRDETAPGLQNGQLSISMLQGGETVLEHIAGGYRRVQRTIVLLCDMDRDRSIHASTQSNRILADVQRAMESDPTLGGDCDLLMYEGWDPLTEGEHPKVGSAITYEIQYTYRRNTPQTSLP